MVANLLKAERMLFYLFFTSLRVPIMKLRLRFFFFFFFLIWIKFISKAKKDIIHKGQDDPEPSLYHMLDIGVD